MRRGTRKVHVRLPGKGNSNSHDARLVHLIITMIKWIRTSRLSIKNSLAATWHQSHAGRDSSAHSGGWRKRWEEEGQARAPTSTRSVPRARFEIFSATLEATQGQILSQSPTDPTSKR